MFRKKSKFGSSGFFNFWKIMEGLPNDIFDHDVHTFPGGEDPVVRAKFQAEIEKANKRVEADEKAEAKKRGRPPAAAKKDAPAEPVPRAQLPDVATRQRTVKLQKIRLYFTHLKHKLSMKEPSAMPKTDAEIDALLAAIEAELHGSGGIEKAGMFYAVGCKTLEDLTQHFNPLGWELRGPVASFSETVMQNRAQWDDLIKEFAISNAEWFMVSCV